MKATRCEGWLVTGCFAVLIWVRTAAAEGSDPVASTNAVPSITIPAPRISDATVSVTPLESPALVQLEPAHGPATDKLESLAKVSLETVTIAEAPTGTMDTSIGLDAPGKSTQQNEEEVQRRLEAPTPEQLIERHGSVGFLIRQSEPRNILELINPFAPAKFGPRERETYNRDPNLKPGATLPRTFINDVTHEPVMSLLNWAW